MSKFNPKEAFDEARETEKKGKRSLASAKYAQLAIRFRRAGKFEDAKSLLRRAIRLSPESPRLYLQMALCEFADHRDGVAKECMENFTRYALQKREKTAEYREYLEAELKDYPNLRAVFYEASLQLDRTDATPFLAKARALMEQSEKEEALRALIDALKTKTHDSQTVELLRELLKWRGEKDSLEHLARFEAGKLPRHDFIALIFPKLKAAEPLALPPPSGSPSAPASPKIEVKEEETLSDLITHLEKELGVDIEESRDTVLPLVNEFRRRSQKVLAGDSKARIDMGLAYFEMGLTEVACEELKAVPLGDPRQPEALCLMGEILYSAGSFLGALEIYHQCLRLEATEGDVGKECHYKLVQIYARLGDWEQAAAHARQLEEAAPDYRDIHGLRIHVEDALARQSGGRAPSAEKGQNAGNGKRSRRQGR